MKKEQLKIGQVSGAHGIKGEIKVYPMTDDPKKIASLKEVELGSKTYSVKAGRVHKGSVLLILDGVKNRDQAEALKGKDVLVERESLDTPDEDEFYIVDLIGLSAFDGEKRIGKISDVLQNTGGNDTLEVKIDDETIRADQNDKRDKKRSLYLPFRQEFVRNISFDDARIDLTIPEEYWDL